MHFRSSIDRIYISTHCLPYKYIQLPVNIHHYPYYPFDCFWFELRENAHFTHSGCSYEIYRLLDEVREE